MNKKGVSIFAGILGSLGAVAIIGKKHKINVIQKKLTLKLSVKFTIVLSIKDVSKGLG
ncbi:hypothetical protein [Periweissella beninensis]|uniref:Uncharacterized protein n=1 Tax=Periweissella beninensis TaxID=504936 RepID=A0ABT0VFW9_9LACO|nr:hypothetical protein [Periweissella beninensis]MCM2436723.1 hypothetical protein [Periweissella beninensis]